MRHLMNRIAVQMSDLCWKVPPLLGTTFHTMNRLENVLVKHDDAYRIDTYASELFYASYCRSYIHL
jgi:hypothetical protein